MNERRAAKWVVAVCVATAVGCAGGGPGSSSTAPAGEGAAPNASSTGTDQTHYESVVEMLRGRVPGLEIVETGEGAIEVRIRGMTQSMGVASDQQPLVVVDGVRSSRPAGEALLSLNPRDVATISVIKDVGSTAIYGTKGANGVILVRLKRR